MSTALPERTMELISEIRVKTKTRRVKKKNVRTEQKRGI